MKAVIQIKKIYMSVQVERVDQETQVSEWGDRPSKARAEQELQEAENERFLKDLYIEELEQDMKKMKEHVAKFLQEREIAEKYSTKLEARMQKLRMTPAGRVLHFAECCPHYSSGQQIRIATCA